MENKSVDTKIGYDLLEQLHSYYAKAFNYFNIHVFDKLLPNVCITLQFSTPNRKNTLGYFRCNTFKVNTNIVPVITIVLDYVETINKGRLDTLIHEMIHFEAHTKGISDVNGKNFHNLNFKRLAENRGYIIKEKMKTYGYSHGEPNERLNNVINNFLKNNPFPYDEFAMIWKESKNESLKKSQFKYVCPECKSFVRGKKGLKLICGECRADYEYIEVFPDEEELLNRLI